MDPAVVEAMKAKIEELESGRENEIPNTPSTKGKAASASASASASAASKPAAASSSGSTTTFKTEIRSLKAEIASLKKQNRTLTSNNDLLSSQLAKVSSAKERLEELCRSLQAHSKAVQEESQARTKLDAKAREELDTKCQDLLSSVQTRLDDQAATSDAIRAENDKLREAYASQAESYEARLKAAGLEKKLAEAKLEQKAEQLLTHVALSDQLAKELEKSRQTEMELRERLAGHLSQYESVKQTLSDSAKTFESFTALRKEGEKQMKKLLKENKAMEKKTRESDVFIIKMVEERDGLRAQVEALTTQKQKVEGLCRVLQQQRADQRKELDELKAAATTSDPEPVAAAAADDETDE